MLALKDLQINFQTLFAPHSTLPKRRQGSAYAFDISTVLVRNLLRRCIDSTVMGLPFRLIS